MKLILITVLLLSWGGLALAETPDDKDGAGSKDVQACTDKDGCPTKITDCVMGPTKQQASNDAIKVVFPQDKAINPNPGTGQ